MMEKQDTCRKLLIQKFTDAMLKLAHDEELRREMSRNAIWKSEDFAIEKAVKEWNRLLIV